jgi:hypothetical protein
LVSFSLSDHIETIGEGKEKKENDSIATAVKRPHF